MTIGVAIIMVTIGQTISVPTASTNPVVNVFTPLASDSQPLQHYQEQIQLHRHQWQRLPGA